MRAQEDLKIRPVTMADADLLLAWRNDPETRAASKSSGVVARAKHIAWLERSLSNPARRLMVAEVAGVPCGTVRADLGDGVWELHWTIAPSHRGKGIGQRMVGAMARSIDAPIRAEVKVGNVASARIAEAAGMTFDREEGGILHFARRAPA